MVIKVVIEFLQGTTVWVRAYIYDKDGDLVDPTTSVKLDVWDSAGTKQVDNQTMDKDSTGIYDYYYNTSTSSAEGNWRGIVWATDDTKVSEGSFGFKVRAQ